MKKRTAKEKTKKNKGNADIKLKDFWRNNERFADLFNSFLFNGQKVLKAEDLQEIDTDVSSVIDLKDYNKAMSRTRDVIKKTYNGIDFVVYGIENQSKVDYAMPLRNMIYDALGYLKEYKEISAKFKTKPRKEKTDDEFLSGIGKSDRFHPIITIVIYYGEQEWDGPFSLSDMMIDLPSEIQNTFANYDMNLLQVVKSGEISFKNADVEAVFKITSKIFEQDFKWIKENYEKVGVSYESAIVIEAITKKDLDIELFKDEKEEVNMCRALEEFRQQGVEEGIEEGKKEGIEEGKEEVARKAIIKGYSTADIADITGLTQEHVEEIRDEIGKGM